MAQEIRGEFETVESCKCPFCGREITNWFCPVCGTPISTNHCMRPEYRPFNDYQFCAKCNTRNPYGAKYCRNCGDDITSQARDKNGHGWVDLGLSVLWSTETMDGFYRWNHSESFYTREREYSSKLTSDGRDAATRHWGNKWRTPTKEEFEELIKECKWEKAVIPNYDKHALKVTGPNGNSIFLPTTARIESVFNEINKDAQISLWTSSKGFQAGSSIPTGYGFVFGEKEILSKRFGTTSEERRRLWLENPVKWLDEKDICSNVKLLRADPYSSIRPVADKKWQGKL